MKNLSTTIVSALAMLALLAIPEKAGAQAANAGAILEKVSQLYKQWSGIDIKFAANIRSEKNNISESFEGTIIMKDDKFVLKTPDMMTWFDGKTQWTYWVRTKEVNLNTPSVDELRFSNPMMILQDYKKDFNVSYIGESTSSNAKIAYDIALTPKKKDDIEKIEVQIEKTTSLPSRLVVTMGNDMRSTITIKEIKEIAPSKEIFTFPERDYPGVEIIDLR